MAKRLAVGVVLVATWLGCAAAWALPFKAIYVFGDSLSDNGSDLALSSAIHAVNPAFPIVPGAPADLPGRFSNGIVAVEYLAAALGLPLTPHYLTPAFLGGATAGNNYAQGGATTGVENASLPGVLPGGLVTSFKGVGAQVTDYLAATPVADPTALYVVWAGPNDYIHPGATAILPSCVAAPSPVICTSITNIANAVGGLAAIGAQHILVPNLPDLSQIPRTIAQGPAAMAGAHALSLAFNATLSFALGQLSTVFPDVIIPFDTAAWLDAVATNPAAFGLVNVTSSCLTGSAADAPSTISAACAGIGPSKYLFWDDIHPTTAGSRILGRAFAAAVLPEPGVVLLVALGLGVIVVTTRRRRMAR